MVKIHPIDSYFKIVNGNYSFRMKVPANLRDKIGKSEFIESLKTKDRGTAQRLAFERLEHYKRVIEMANADYDISLIENYKKEKRKLRTLFAADAFENVRTAAENNIDSFVLSLSDSEIITLFTELKNEKFSNDMMDKVMTEAKIHIPYNAKETVRAVYRESVVDRVVELYKFKKINDIKAIKNPNDFENRFISKGDKIGAPYLEISKIYNRFLDVHSHIRDNIKEKPRYDNVISSFIDFAGDIPLNYITKNIVLDFFIMLERYPARRDNVCVNMKFKDVISYYEGKNYNSLSEKSMKEWAQRLKRLWTFAADTNENENINIKNPFDNIGKYLKGRKTEVKRNFKTDEIKVIFENIIGHEGHKYWLPIFLLFHGCRLSEVADQTNDSIKQSENGVWYVDVKKGKTKQSIRQIPIHQFLIDRGFIDYVNRNKNQEWLFPEFNREGRIINGIKREARSASVQYSNYFSRFLNGLNIKDESISLHSLRHTWISAATAQGISKEFRVAIVGHEADDVHGGTYTHHDLITLKEQIDKVKFNGFPY